MAHQAEVDAVEAALQAVAAVLEVLQVADQEVITVLQVVDQVVQEVQQEAEAVDPWVAWVNVFIEGHERIGMIKKLVDVVGEVVSDPEEDRCISERH